MIVVSFRKVFVLLFVFGVFSALYLNFFAGDNVIAGADDFKIDSPFSEDNFAFKNRNDEDMFIAKDYDGNTLNIEKLDDEKFKNIVSPDFKNEGYSLYSVTHYEDNIYFYDVEGQFCLCEVVEVDGNKYKIIIGDCSGNGLFENNNMSSIKLREWQDYLLNFNKINNVTVLKLDLNNSVSDTTDN